MSEISQKHLRRRRHNLHAGWGLVIIDAISAAGSLGLISHPVSPESLFKVSSLLELLLWLVIWNMFAWLALFTGLVELRRQKDAAPLILVCVASALIGFNCAMILLRSGLV